MLFELIFIITLAKSLFQSVRNWFNKYNFSSWSKDGILPTEHRMSYYSGIPLYLYGIPLPVLALISKWGLYALVPVKIIPSSTAWLKISSFFTSPLSKSQISIFQTNPWGLHQVLSPSKKDLIVYSNTLISLVSEFSCLFTIPQNPVLRYKLSYSCNCQIIVSPT